MSAHDVGIFHHCRAQRGLVTLDQLHGLGLSSDQVLWRVQHELLIRANTNVFRHPVSPVSWEQQVLAATFAAGTEALAARRTSARLWELSTLRTSRVEIVVERWTRRPRVQGQLIESTDLLPSDAADVQGIPTTAVPRTLIDCASKVGPARLREMADEAVHRKLMSYEDLLDRFVRLARRGRPGVTTTRALLEQRLGVQLGTNAFETMVLDIIRDHGLPMPVVQHPVIIDGRKFFLDMAWPEVKRFVECDGWEWHGRPQRHSEDLQRQNILVLAEWKPLRFTWQTVTEQPGLVADEISAAVASRPASNDRT
jgi:very-short-patch-repair endonuclease